MAEPEEREITIPDLTQYAFVTRSPDPYEPAMELRIDITCLQQHPAAGASHILSIPDLFKPEGYSYSFSEVVALIALHHEEHHT